MTSAQKKLVILDLDETLIHATRYPLGEVWDFEVFNYKVYKRPGLEDFLEELKGNFEVGVWSSASDEYVDVVVNHIFPDDYGLKFVWGRSKCTLQYNSEASSRFNPMDQNHLHYVKMLKKVEKSGLGDLDHMLIIDDTPHKAQHNYGNAIYPKMFLGEKSDNELLWLGRYLKTLMDKPNIRAIEKRFWKKEIMEQYTGKEY